MRPTSAPRATLIQGDPSMWKDHVEKDRVKFILHSCIYDHSQNFLRIDCVFFCLFLLVLVWATELLKH